MHHFWWMQSSNCAARCRHIAAVECTDMQSLNCVLRQADDRDVLTNRDEAHVGKIALNEPHPSYSHNVLAAVRHV